MPLKVNPFMHGISECKYHILRFRLAFTALFTHTSLTRARIITRRGGKMADAHANENMSCWKICGARISCSEVRELRMYSSSKVWPCMQ
jgi:hypothetical protein